MLKTIPLTQADTDLMSEVIERTRAAIQDAGYTISDQRWPFTYHHDHCRGQVNGTFTPGESSLSRGDVAVTLREWAMGTASDPGPGAATYIWEAVKGATRYLTESHRDGDPTKLSGLQAEIDQIVGSLEDSFISYLRNKVVRSAEERASLHTTDHQISPILMMNHKR